MAKKTRVFQVFNQRSGAWVKMKRTNGGSRILNVKERNPDKPFKGVPFD